MTGRPSGNLFKSKATALAFVLTVSALALIFTRGGFLRSDDNRSATHTRASINLARLRRHHTSRLRPLARARLARRERSDAQSVDRQSSVAFINHIIFIDGAGRYRLFTFHTHQPAARAAAAPALSSTRRQLAAPRPLTRPHALLRLSRAAVRRRVQSSLHRLSRRQSLDTQQPLTSQD